VRRRPKAFTPIALIVAVAIALVINAMRPRPMLAQGYTEAVCAEGRGGITLTVEAQFIVLRGGVCPKDDGKFRAFVKTVDPSIRTVKLISGGGNGEAAQAIGEFIRKSAFDTYVNGAVDRCASACTHIFAAGVHRIYSGAADIVTGSAARRGLGYHYLDANHPGETDAEKDRKFNATAVPYLKKMLPAPAAAAALALMRANHTTQMTWLNGDEALRAGIATSLGLQTGLN
jgi:hypothetical protein